MNEFLRATYGDPCRGCGYNWSIEAGACKAIIGESPARVRALVDGVAARKRHASLQWNATAYVVHVGDVLRIWAERIAGLAIDGSNTVVPYDERLLGEVRGYGDLPMSGAPWALERAVGDWKAAEELADSVAETFDHPEQGTLSVDAVRRIIAHEIEHHAADLLLTLSA